MIIIKVGKNEHIDRALKRFKRKFRNTQVVKKLRDKQHFIKKSEKRRHEIQQATYKHKKFGDEE